MGCDPNAQLYKEEMMAFVKSLGHEVVDFGSDDIIYAHVATKGGEAVAAKQCDRGILFCGTGIGVMLAKELISAYLECEYVYNERSGKKVDAIVEYEQTH